MIWATPLKRLGVYKIFVFHVDTAKYKTSLKLFKVNWVIDLLENSSTLLEYQS